ncbi:MAG: glycosyl transferase [Sphingobacteriales bacterium]|nr:glycosyl transferase [Sphingobacteriales bacterium]
MKIFYAVQATGNGHISRAMTLLPHLQQYGTVDLFLSGSNANLELDAPVKYRSRGISLFYNCQGGLDYREMAKKINPVRIHREIRDLPVENYDLVLNDFDYITSAACARKKIPSVHFGHQASFQSARVPRPEKQARAGEWVLTKFVKAPYRTGYHFEKYDTGIFEPVVKKEILDANPVIKNHITIYLPSYCEIQLKALFEKFPDHRFHIFSRETKFIREEKNLVFLPVNRDLFSGSLIQCRGIICGAGFETPAEALHLGKKILAIPINGQYEQLCNAAALRNTGIRCLDRIDHSFPLHFEQWIQDKTPPVKKDYSNSIRESLDYVFSLPLRVVPEAACTLHRSPVLPC